MNSVIIALDGVPPSLNKFAGRRNNIEYRRQKEKWTQYVLLASAGKRPKRPFDKAVVTIEYRFKNRIRRDPDNYCGKLLLDGLTKAGIIADDSFYHIELRLKADREPGSERTIIKVKNLEG